MALTKEQEAIYHAANRADEHFHAELERVYGKRAREMRYRPHLWKDAKLKEAAAKFQRATDEWMAIMRSFRQSNPSRRSPAGRTPVHTAAWDRCVKDVKAKGGAYSPYAVCSAALGETGSIKAGHRRKNPSGFQLEKTQRLYFVVHAHPHRGGGERLWLTQAGHLSRDKAKAARYTSVEVAVARAKAHLKRYPDSRKYRFDVCVSD